MTRDATAANPSTAAHKIDDIQILRGIAITMVLTCHLSFSATLLSSLPGRLSNSFYAGVELFFVISGFVVTRSLIRSNYEPISFLIRRGFRLYPPILAFLAFSGIINAIILVADWPKYAVTAFCVPFSVFTEQAAAILGGYLINLVRGPYYMNGAMWSLSVEFQFYAAAALLTMVAVAVRASPRLIGCAVGACAIAVYAVASYARILLTLGQRPDFGTYLLSFNFDYMALGVLLAYVPESALLRPMRFGRVLSIGLILIPIIVLAFCRSPLIANGPGPDYLTGAGMLAVAPCYLALVVLAVGGNLSRALPRTVYGLLLWVGERSYTIYLLHFPTMVVTWVIVVAVHIAWAENAWSWAVVQLVITLAVLLPVTEVTYRLLELRSIQIGAMVVSAWRRWRSPPALARQQA